MTTKFTVTCEDGRVITAIRYSAIHSPKNRLIIINSALGVRQSFYEPLALYLSVNGYTVITWDPRSIGQSSIDNIKEDQSRLRDWGKIDLDAVLNHVTSKNWASSRDITILGHSAGGHLVGLCRSITKVKNIVLISSGTCGWRLYPVMQWPKLLLAWYIMFPIFIRVLGYVPGQFGIGHDLSKGVALDWRNWSTNKDYLFSDDTLANTYYHQYEGDIHSIGFSDDVGFSPRKTIYDLVGRFPKAKKQVRIFEPKELDQTSIGHFGFFNKNKRQLWDKILIELLNNQSQ